MSYSPPTSLKIHLSKIDIPELRPRLDIKHPPSIKPQPAAELRKQPELPNGADRAQGKQKEVEKPHESDRDRQRVAEEERKRARELEKAQKKAEKEAKKADKSKKGALNMFPL